VKGYARRCLLEPVSQIFEAVELLQLAVECHRMGDVAKAETLIQAADMLVIYEWTEAIWGKQDGAIHQLFNVPNSPPILSRQDRVPVRMPNAKEKDQLLERDGYICSFCNIPLISGRVRKAMNREYPSAARWGRKNKEQHSALQAMWLQFDHVLPHSRGGDNSLDNILVTCAPCNYGRMDYTLDELNLEDPRSRKRISSNWTGLVDFLHRS